jgi:hypothetical protein
VEFNPSIKWTEYHLKGMRTNTDILLFFLQMLDPLLFLIDRLVKTKKIVFTW